MDIADHGAMVRKETEINTVVTAVIAALLSWQIFRGQHSIAAINPPVGGMLGILPGTFNFTLLVSLALTLITRRRVHRGLFRRLALHERNYLGTQLPRNILARSLLLAVLATLVFVPATVGAVWAVVRAGWISPNWSFLGMALFFVVYFVILSMVVTPIIIWRALGD